MLEIIFVYLFNVSTQENENDTFFPIKLLKMSISLLQNVVS